MADLLDFPPDYPFTSLATAAAVTPTSDPHTYTADLKRDWCIGIVPHGGYLTTILLNASTHFFTAGPAAARSQPHAILSTTTFTTRCRPGPATLHITPIKYGRQYSVVRVDLSQATLCLSATVTHGSLALESSGFHLPIPAPSLPPLADCITTPDADPSIKFRIAASKLEYAFPRGTVLGSRPDEPWRRVQWVRLADGARIRVNDLAFLADMFLPLIENWGEKGPLKHWYPTLTMSLDVKTAGEDGWEWVGMEIKTGTVRGGRMDIDVLMVGLDGEVLALSRHSALVVGVERNTGGKGKGASKI